MIVPVFPVDTLSVLKGHNEISPQPSLLQAEQPQLSQPFLTGEVLQPSDHCCGLLCPRPNRSMSYLRREFTMRCVWREEQGEWGSPEHVHPDRSFLCSQVGSVVLVPCVDGDAGIPPLLRVVPTHEGASPHSPLSREMPWGEDALQQAVDSSSLDTALV